MTLLDNLGIKDINSGACTGPNGWLATEDGKILESVNPATGEVIATVRQCSEDDYETIIKASTEAFLEWRIVPAPVRG